ncbi:uncharacterized protein LOC8263370 isoform X4 [Ricinus communis]|uniref:uncharacterized protein LOC8263370 isoform X4 n=1 Tax=Ricinus communis TaxID=3988 RepID=UPI00201A7B21|nr:uncharacterized protein LOC8263370 isoform X4 [Ricinus communis]
MSSEMDFQKFQFPDVLDNRKKVDVQLIETLNSQQMRNTTRVFVHTDRDFLKSEPVFDLRKSLAWDSAFSNSPGLIYGLKKHAQQVQCANFCSSFKFSVDFNFIYLFCTCSGVLDPEELFETLNLEIADNGVDMTGHRRPISLPSESMASARTSGISSLRKSLAWDSAFFTSAGVLDAEELSVINRGFRSPELALHPGVKEEILRSAESNSLVNSDGYSLGSLEIDLPDDIRASMRKSRNASSNGASSACKLKREKGREKSHVSRILDASSQVRNAASSGGSNPLSSRKPPKISSRANPSPILPSKRASLSASLSKMDNKATKSADGKHMAISKKMRLRESCSSISSSMPSANSPSAVFPAAPEEFARFCNASADFTRKSPSTPLRRTANFSLAASDSRFRTPLKYSVGNKSELENSTGLAQNGGLKFHSGGQGTSSKTESGVSKANLSANRMRYSKHPSAGTITGPVSKSGMKNEGKICLREKRQPLKEHRVLRAYLLGACNKENIVSFENQVDDLSQRMGAIGFSRDLPAGRVLHILPFLE